MLSGDRRGASVRRGMTVLGRIPAVPKPINLPSQRLENRGLDPNVEIVPRGGVSWGSAGRSPPTVNNAWGAGTQSSSPPQANGTWASTQKQAPGVSSSGAAWGGTAQSRPSSAGSGTRPSSAGSVGQTQEPQAATNAWGPPLLPSTRPLSASATSRVTSSSVVHGQSQGPVHSQPPARPRLDERPRSAEARPQASRLGEPPNFTTTPAWGGVGADPKTARESHQPTAFQLTRVDFPTLGSEKSPDLRPQQGTANMERGVDDKVFSGHQRQPPNLSGQFEEMPRTAVVASFGAPERPGLDTWRRDPSFGSLPGVEGNWHREDHRQMASHDGHPPVVDSWRRESGHDVSAGASPSDESWRRGGPLVGPAGPHGPGRFAHDPSGFPPQQRYGPGPGPGPGPYGRGGPSGYGHHVGDVYGNTSLLVRQGALSGRPGPPLAPGAYPGQGPVPYDGSYAGPPIEDRGMMMMGMGMNGPGMYVGFQGRQGPPPEVFNRYPHGSIGSSPRLASNSSRGMREHAELGGPEGEHQDMGTYKDGRAGVQDSLGSRRLGGGPFESMRPGSQGGSIGQHHGLRDWGASANEEPMDFSKPVFEEDSTPGLKASEKFAGAASNAGNDLGRESKSNVSDRGTYQADDVKPRDRHDEHRDVGKFAGRSGRKPGNQAGNSWHAGESTHEGPRVQRPKEDGVKNGGLESEVHIIKKENRKVTVPPEKGSVDGTRKEVSSIQAGKDRLASKDPVAQRTHPVKHEDGASAASGTGGAMRAGQQVVQGRSSASGHLFHAATLDPAGGPVLSPVVEAAVGVVPVLPVDAVAAMSEEKTKGMKRSSSTRKDVSAIQSGKDNPASKDPILVAQRTHPVKHEDGASAASGIMHGTRKDVSSIQAGKDRPASKDPILVAQRTHAVKHEDGASAASGTGGVLRAGQQVVQGRSSTPGHLSHAAILSPESGPVLSPVVEAAVGVVPVLPVDVGAAMSEEKTKGMKRSSSAIRNGLNGELGSTVVAPNAGLASSKEHVSKEEPLYKAKAAHDAEKEWRPKATSAEVKVDGSSGTTAQTGEVSVGSPVQPVTTSEAPLPGPGKGEIGTDPSTAETYDYEAQRAKMKEIAHQRSLQLQKEEEERNKEQKAKAYAKLEELNRRATGAPAANSVSTRKKRNSRNPKSKQKSDGVDVPTQEVVSSEHSDVGESVKCELAQDVVSSVELSSESVKDLRFQAGGTDGVDGPTQEVVSSEHSDVGESVKCEPVQDAVSSVELSSESVKELRFQAGGIEFGDLDLHKDVLGIQSGSPRSNGDTTTRRPQRKLQTSKRPRERGVQDVRIGDKAHMNDGLIWAPVRPVVNTAVAASKGVSEEGCSWTGSTDKGYASSAAVAVSDKHAEVDSSGSVVKPRQDTSLQVAGPSSAPEKNSNQQASERVTGGAQQQGSLPTELRVEIDNRNSESRNVRPRASWRQRGSGNERGPASKSYPAQHQTGSRDGNFGNHHPDSRGGAGKTSSHPQMHEESSTHVQGDPALRLQELGWGAQQQGSLPAELRVETDNRPAESRNVRPRASWRQRGSGNERVPASKSYPAQHQTGSRDGTFGNHHPDSRGGAAKVSGHPQMHEETSTHVQGDPALHGRPQGEHGRHQGEHERPQGEHGRPQGEHGRPQGEHGRPQGEHGRPQGEHGRPQGEHGRPQGEHGRPQGEHGRPHGEHGRPQGEHGRPQGEHGRPHGEHGRPQGENRRPQVEHGRIQNEQGRYQTEHGRSHNEHGRHHNEHGRPQNEQGRPYNGHGRFQNDQGRPYNEHRRHQSEQGQPQKEHGQSQNEQGRPLNVQGRPRNEQQRPQNDQQRLQNEKGRPQNEQGRPQNEQGRPQNEQGRPPNEQGRPQNEQQRLQNEKGRPQNEQGRPQNEQQRPQNEQQRPQNEQQRHQNEQRPQNEQQKPQNEHQRSQNEQQGSRNELQRPRNEQQRPPNEQQRPQNEQQRPRNEQQRPQNQQGRLVKASKQPLQTANDLRSSHSQSVSQGAGYQKAAQEHQPPQAVSGPHKLHSAESKSHWADSASGPSIRGRDHGHSKLQADTVASKQPLQTANDQQSSHSQSVSQGAGYQKGAQERRPPHAVSGPHKLHSAESNTHWADSASGPYIRGRDHGHSRRGRVSVRGGATGGGKPSAEVETKTEQAGPKRMVIDATGGAVPNLVAG